MTRHVDKQSKYTGYAMIMSMSFNRLNKNISNLV